MGTRHVRVQKEKGKNGRRHRSFVGVHIASVIGYAAAAWIKSISHSNIARISTLYINALRATQNLDWEISEADILARVYYNLL